MKIEILFPEVCNLFGDMANMRYLKLCLPEAEFIHTSLNQKPRFLTEYIDLVYMAPTTENYQVKIIEILKPYTKDIKEKINSGMNFFFVANSLEILGNYIETPEGEKIPALGIFDMYAKQNFKERHNSECEGHIDGCLPVLGFKTQFTQCFPANEDHGLFKLNKGMGMNMQSTFEGIRFNNFFGTYFLGPIFIMNPDFTKYFLKNLGVKINELPFEKELYDAYNKKLVEFNNFVKKNPNKYKYM